MLTRRGYRLVGFENVLGRPLDANTGSEGGRSSDATIAESPDDELATWLDVVVTGFAHRRHVAGVWGSAFHGLPRGAARRLKPRSGGSHRARTATAALSAIHAVRVGVFFTGFCSAEFVSTTA